eukprot:scaffold212549_cov45-Attheya_sp.AAC.3
MMRKSSTSDDSAMNEGRLQIDEARSSLSPHPSPCLLQAAKRQKKTTRESTNQAQPNSIQILTKDELVHVFSFIGIFDHPVALRETCRHFSNEIDWGLIIRNCVLCSRRWFKYKYGRRSLQNLYMQQTIRQQFICQVLVNPTLNGTLMRDLLLMAVNENDTETVQQLLAEETCRVDGVLDKALIRDKTEIAAILQNDPRVKSLIVMCSECNENPGCVVCLTVLAKEVMCADPDGASKQYCKNCTRDKLCAVCEKHQCVHCENVCSFHWEYYPCSTCGETVCQFNCDDEISIEPCFRKCQNYDELCHNIQCNTCARDDSRELSWYQCAADSEHVFCQECNPDRIEYDIDRENGQSCCPACQNKGVRDCWNSDICGETELDTLEESSDWYRCPDDSGHMFGPNCDPTKPGIRRDTMIEEGGFDLDKCTACQGFHCC